MLFVLFFLIGFLTGYFAGFVPVFLPMLHASGVKYAWHGTSSKNDFPVPHLLLH
jgi:hypothetical protein